MISTRKSLRKNIDGAADCFVRQGMLRRCKLIAEQKIQWIKKFLMIGLILLTALSFLKSIFISRDIDEAYAVAQSYRIVRGDRLLIDMWEPHQFSAVLGAAFIAPFVSITGSTEYLVIYLRCISILIHCLLGLLLYYFCSRQVRQKEALSILFLHLLFLPKWVQSVEFELMHYWAALLCFLCFAAYLKLNRGKKWLFLAGICVVLAMQCYPTMVLLYPIYLSGLIIYDKQQIKKPAKMIFQDILAFSGGALGSGILFLLYLMRNQTLSEFYQNLMHLFSDKSHTQYTFLEKIQRLLPDFGQELFLYLGIFVVILLLCRIGIAIRKQDIFKGELVLISMLGTIIVLEIIAVVGSLFFDQNQFYLQIRYIAMILPGIYLFFRNKKKFGFWMYFSVLPALVSVLAVLAVSNMNTNVAYSKSFVGVIGTGIMLAIYLEDGKSAENMRLQIISRMSICSMLIGLLVCRLVLIRVTGCLPVTMRASLEKITAGPEKGIYVLRDEAEVWNENYAILKQYVAKDDKLFYVGAENMIYVAAESELATPSTQGTTVFNEMIEQYFTEYPEKMPDVIIIDKTFETVYEYRYSAENIITMNWIEENYSDAAVVETDYLKILTRK
jgi:hypothetical protein